MRLIKCEKGHYFDNDKFENCPHCEGIEFETEEGSFATQVTEMLEDTIPYAVNQAPLVGESSKAAFEQGLEEMEKSFGEEEEETAEAVMTEYEASYDDLDAETSESETVNKDDSVWEITEESIEEVNNTSEAATEEDALYETTSESSYADEAAYEAGEAQENVAEDSGVIDLSAEQSELETAVSEEVAEPVAEESVQESANAESVSEAAETTAEETDKIEDLDAVFEELLEEDKVYLNTNPVAGLFVALDGPNKGDAYVVREGRNFIGRSENMDIRVPHNEKICTDKYAIVIYDKRSDKFFFQPGESRDLFYLNDDLLIATAEFKNDDIIYMANVQFLFIELKHPKISWR